MNDRNDSSNSLWAFLNQVSAPILAGISLISGIYGFVKLFVDKDAGLVTLISLAIGVLLLLGICLYYARFWKPEKHDRGRSAFEPSSDEQVKAQAKKERRRKRVRRSAVAGLILLPILSLSGVVGWQYFQSLPAKDIIVLVAEFDGPDPKTYGVTEKVINQLRQATENYADVRVEALNKSITEQEGSKTARTVGEKRKATIVIWGWYRNPGEVVPLSVNFEVLRSPKDLPELGQTAKGNIQQAAIADLKSFTLQTRLSNEMSYLSLFTLGMARRAAGDWEGAIARFSDALSQKTESSSSLNQSLVYFYRGSAYLLKGDYNRALADLNQAIKRQPNFVEAHAIRVIGYLAKGEYNRALADANLAIKLKPDMALAYDNRGLIYLATGDYNRAIADFNQTLKLLPAADHASDSIHADGSQVGTLKLSDSGVSVVNFAFSEVSDYLIYNNLGTAYYAKNDFARALEALNQAIKLQPDRAFAYFNRASVYFSQKNYDYALADLNQTIKLQPALALAYLKRASVYYIGKGDSDRALADLNQAIKLQPSSALLHTMRGEIYSDISDYDRALLNYDQALKLQPNDAEIYHDRGLTYAKKRNYDHAIADYNRALKLKPGYAKAYNSRGVSYKRKGDFDRAIADYNQAIKLEPDDAGAYNNRGFAYAEKGDYDRALTDINQALKLSPNEATIYDSRGFAYAGKGNYGRAIADYNQALRLKPDADYAYYHRGMAYRKQGNKAQAIADFKRTLELTQNPKKRQDTEKQLQELDRS